MNGRKTPTYLLTFKRSIRVTWVMNQGFTCLFVDPFYIMLFYAVKHSLHSHVILL